MDQICQLNEDTLLWSAEAAFCQGVDHYELIYSNLGSQH